MSALIELLGHLFVDVFMASTGGFILWVYEGRKKPLKTYINPEYDKSFMLGMAFWILVAVIITLFYYFTQGTT